MWFMHMNGTRPWRREVPSPSAKYRRCPSLHPWRWLCLECLPWSCGAGRADDVMAVPVSARFFHEFFKNLNQRQKQSVFMSIYQEGVLSRKPVATLGAGLVLSGLLLLPGRGAAQLVTLNNG